MYLSPAVDKAVTRPTQWDHTHPMLTRVTPVVVPYSCDGAVTAGAQAQPCRRQQAKPHSPCDRGVRLLSRGHRIATDRLHAHILSLMLGIPHYAADNLTGKVHAFIDCWTGSSPLVTKVGGFTEIPGYSMAGAAA